MRSIGKVFCLLSLVLVLSEARAEEIRLAIQPNLSPDGTTLLFVYGGDIWSVPTEGGQARRLTTHPADESEPHFSPDGERIAFVSERTGSPQIYFMPATGGRPEQKTHHTEGYSLQGWFPDSSQVLALATRDHFWRNAQRFFSVTMFHRSVDRLLFDGYGTEGSLSPDGTKLLFVREGERWWRKGYRGARSAQIWLYDIKAKEFSQLLKMDTGCRSPVWKPDGSGFYYCGSQGAKNGARNLHEFSLADGSSRQLTNFKDDLVTSPCVSGDGKTVVFSHLFDLYRLSIGNKKQTAKPERIRITIDSDETKSSKKPTLRRSIQGATNVAFTKDGLEIAMIVGGDLWVMDTELREPRQVTSTPEFEADPVFSADGNAIFFISWEDTQPDIWKSERADSKRYWWQNDEFKLTRLTEDGNTESSLRLSPNGTDLAFVRDRGDLWLLDTKSGKTRSLFESFLPPAFDFSPDGKWIVYSQSDNDFNSDIWVRPVDGSSDPVNISRHPDDESNPVWSPDGKLIAFTGRRADDETDVYFVWTQKQDDETGSRDRKLKKALETLDKARKKKPASTSAEPPKPEPAKEVAPEKGKKKKRKKKKPEEKPEESTGKPAKEAKEEEAKTEPKLPEVKIDFDGIQRRLRRISIPNSTESNLFWSHDSKKLAFSASVDGKRGTYSVQLPDSLTPKLITTSTGSRARWTKSPDRILWLTSGVPTSQAISGAKTAYSFTVYQTVTRSDRHRAAFNAAWRVMNDWWYDSNFANRDWDRVHRKYTGVAGNAPDLSALSRVIHLMLGELNGSHLGFRHGTPPRDTGDDWRPVTAHLGVRFDSSYVAPGLKIADVIPRGPADQVESRLAAGEIILTIDGMKVDRSFDLTQVLNGRLDRDISLRVRGADKKATERDVVLRPTTYSAVRSQLYRKWMDSNREQVKTLAKGKLGYLHIRGMNWPSFLEFERELYDVAYGKDGLIIDVRDNGGGFTTDHLLTALTQPRHAITVPRGGGSGYPHSRMVYATWDKPIVVLCNQNSYSNAEIFSHAIKGLGRGKVVGVPTAGGVISTGIAPIMDVGILRRPFRGWFVRGTGEDMELNGCVPHEIVWPRPTEIPSGKDRQLETAVKVLRKQVKKSQKSPQPKLRKATERE